MNKNDKEIRIHRDNMRFYLYSIVKNEAIYQIEETVYELCFDSVIEFIGSPNKLTNYINIMTSMLLYHKKELHDFIKSDLYFSDECLFVPHIRGEYRKKFERFVAEDKAKIIELSCYKAIINSSKKSDSLICRRWDTIFKTKYELRCNTILELLNPESLSCQNYGEFLDITQMSDDELSKLGEKSARELYPIAYEHEDRIIRQRLDQKIVLKTSSLFPCPKCKSPSTYEEKQTRSLDEATNFYCVCSVCHHKFKR